MKFISYLHSTLCIAALLFTTSSMAQFSIGGRAGINIASYSWEKDITNNDGLNTSSIVVPHVGFAAIWEASEAFNIQGELNYVQKGAKFSQNFENTTVNIGGQNVQVKELDNTVKTVAHYLEVPLFAKLRLGSDRVAAQILAGPSVGFALSARQEANLDYTQADGQEVSNSDTEKLDIDKDGNRIDFGINFGAGMEIGAGPGRVLFDLRYQIGLANILNKGDDPDDRRKNRGFEIGVGYVVPL